MLTEEIEEVVKVSPKGQVTLPSKLRKKMRIAKGEQLLLIKENNIIKLVPIPKLSKLAGIDKELFKGRRPSEEIEAERERDERREETRKN